MYEEQYRRCCGIDVHKKSVTVCILPPDGVRGEEPKQKVFRTFTRDLIALRTWLKNCRVTDVAMELPGLAPLLAISLTYPCTRNRRPRSVADGRRTRRSGLRRPQYKFLK